MKKVIVHSFLFCCIAIMITACSGNANNSSSSSLDDKKTESSQWLDKYDILVEKNNALQDRIKRGDIGAVQEISEISKEMIDLSNTLQQNKGAMSPSESKRLIDIMQKIKY